MFLKVIFLSALISFAKAQIGEVCTENTGSMPHPSNCSKFFSCGSGKVVEMECPSRLHFNAEKKVCDWPASAGCEKFTNTNQEDTIDDLTAVPYPGGACRPSQERNNPRIAAYTESCEKFLICTGIWIVMDCPARLWYSVESGKCEKPENAKCCLTCSAPTCKKDGDLLANPENCQKFYICSGSSLIELTCVGDLVFNVTSGECELGATCNSTQPPSVKESFPYCSIEGALYPNYKNCANFFMCNGGQLVDQSCPPNKFFSAEHRNCQPKSIAVCAGVVDIKRQNDI